MAPKKRKAQQRLPAIDEEPQAGSSLPQQAKDADTVMVDASANDMTSVEDAVKELVKECKEKVEEKAEGLILAARKRVQSLRADMESAITRLSKQTRQISVVDFFLLSPEEAEAQVLPNVLQRLQALEQAGDGPVSAETVREVAASLAKATIAVVSQPAVATDAAGPSEPKQGNLEQQDEPQVAPQQAAEQDEDQQAAADQQMADQPVATTSAPQHQQAASQPLQQDLQNEQRGAATDRVSTASACKSGMTVSLMPPPPPRNPLAAANPPARAPMANEVFYSANGSPIHLGTACPPSTTVKGLVPSLADATPAVGMGPATAVAPPTMAFTGRTFRRAAPTRGRTKQPTRAITVTTQDGKQFTVDDLIGLAGVPDAYREEVRKLVESDLQDLAALVQSVSSLEESTAKANAAAAAPATTRATRRR